MSFTLQHLYFDDVDLSLAGALAYEPDGSDAHLVFQLRPGAYNDETLIEFLTELNEFEQQLSTIASVAETGLSRLRASGATA